MTDFEYVGQEEGIISSNSPAKLQNRGVQPHRQRYTIFMDNLRLIGYPLLKDDPEYTEDTFEIFYVYDKDKFFTPESLRVLADLKPLLTGEQKSAIVELRFGTYEKNKVVGRKRK